MVWFDTASRASRGVNFGVNLKSHSDVTRPGGTPWITVLSGSLPIAQGTVRQVWDRPDHPDQIIKTIQPGKVEKFANRHVIRRFIDDWRYGPYRSFRIENRYYSRTAYKCLKAGLPNPIVEMGGLIVTDLGLAQVCAKITDKSGALAQTVEKMVEDKTIDAAHVRWLNEFADLLYHLNVSVPDLSLANVVFDEPHSRFLVVDGYGDKAKIPLRAWFRRINRKKLDRRFMKMNVPGILEWNPELRRFSRALG